MHVSECYHKIIHNITVLQESVLLEHVEDSEKNIGDKAQLVEAYAVTPRKKPGKRELTQNNKHRQHEMRLIK